jgi:hypothetical protein
MQPCCMTCWLMSLCLVARMGHHGVHGTTAAAMIHCVLSIYVSFVRELYVTIHLPAK